jgi:hypothetical protein
LIELLRYAPCYAVKLNTVEFTVFHGVG